MKEKITIWAKYNNNYLVSIDGDAISLNKYKKKKDFSFLRLKGTIKSTGYVSYNFSKGQVLIHRIVAELFIKKVNNKNFVCHIDDIKINNKIDNLYWGNQSDNMKDASRNGLCNKMPINWIKSAIKANTTKCFIEKNGEEIEFESMTKASEYIGVSKSTLSQAIKNDRRTNGYKIRKSRR